ncbi:hypothetical protein BC830DRAFT_1109908 [Chytriomyces sp. MP71]|nr:hypothetical protein BC830DRAFT_1109908 [Chytriomyces sp. MP71]
MSASATASPESSQHSYYQLLGIAPDADADQIRRGYRKAALRCHPDKRGNDPAAAEEFQAVAKAYEVLSDEKKRKVYDAYGAEAVEIMDQIPFLDPGMLLAMRSMFRVAAVLSLVILLFPIFVSLKADGKITWYWVAVFAPTFVVLAIVMVGRVLSTNYREDAEREDKWTARWKKFYNFGYTAVFTGFDVLVALRMDDTIACSWAAVFAPWFCLEVSHFVSTVLETWAQIKLGTPADDETPLDKESGVPLNRRPLSGLEVVFSVFSNFHFLVLRVAQAVLLVMKLDSNSLSWTTTFIPLYIYIILILLTILMGILVRLLSTQGPRAGPLLCFLVAFITVSGIGIVFPVLLVRRLSWDDGYPPAGVLLIPVFVVLSLALCMFGCLFPCLLRAGVSVQEEQMRTAGHGGGAEAAEEAPLAGGTARGSRVESGESVVVVRGVYSTFQIRYPVPS